MNNGDPVIQADASVAEMPPSVAAEVNPLIHARVVNLGDEEEYIQPNFVPSFEPEIPMVPDALNAANVWPNQN